MNSNQKYPTTISVTYQDALWLLFWVSICAICSFSLLNFLRVILNTLLQIRMQGLFKTGNLFYRQSFEQKSWDLYNACHLHYLLENDQRTKKNKETRIQRWPCRSSKHKAHPAKLFQISNDSILEKMNQGVRTNSKALRRCICCTRPCNPNVNNHTNKLSLQKQVIIKLPLLQNVDLMWIRNIKHIWITIVCKLI